MTEYKESAGKSIGEIAQEQMDAARKEGGVLPAPMPEGRYRVVSDRELEVCTGHGSRVVRVLDRTVLHKERRTVLHKERRETHENSYHRGTEEASVWGPGQAFLIFTPVTAEQRELEMENVRSEASVARTKAFDAEQKLKELEKLHEKKNAEYLASNRAEREINTHARQRADTAEERAHKMELDLAKVRKEIGEAAWKRILAGGE